LAIGYTVIVFVGYKVVISSSGRNDLFYGKKVVSGHLPNGNNDGNLDRRL
jgi:hypothetical protein